MEGLRERLLELINKEGLEKFSMRFVLHGKLGYAYKRKHDVQMTPQEKKTLLYQQKVGEQIRNALLSHCEGERTPDKAIDNFFKLLYKHPYYKNMVKSRIL